MKKPIVLVIDDDPTIRKAIAIALREERVEVREACNGREGLALVEELEPVVIILDLLMYGMTGIEFLETLRPRPCDPYAVIVLTGNYIDEDIKRCFDLGCYYFTRKPFTLVEICCLVNRCLDFKRMEATYLRHQEQLLELAAPIAAG